MNGKMIFTDQTHDRAEREVFPSPYVPAAQCLTASDSYVDGFLGFGVAITPASCYVLSKMDADERKALLTHIYGKEGLGLSTGRICIASTDYAPELYSYDDVEGDVTLAHFSTKRDEAYVIPIIKEILSINPSLYLLASPWSPPYWMKTGGYMCGGYMREQYLDCYADYIVKFIKAYAAYGIKISAVTPQNESNTQQSGRMPACVWHPELEAKFISILHGKLAENALDVKIWMYDHNFNDVSRVLWSLKNCDGLLDRCDGVAFHYYGGCAEETAIVKETYPTLDLHFTEGGPRLSEHYATDWCKWALMITSAIKSGYRSFTGWNLMLDEFGGPNVGPYIGICGGLITRDSRTGELSYSGQYKVYSHIAPYVTPASKLRYLSPSNFGMSFSSYPKIDKPLEGLLIENPNGERVAVLANANDHGVQAQLSLNGEFWYIEAEADSVSTIIL